MKALLSRWRKGVAVECKWEEDGEMHRIEFKRGNQGGSILVHSKREVIDK